MAFAPQQAIAKGRYTIERELNRGRFGVSYLAQDSRGDRFVIKSLNEAVLEEFTQAEKDRWSNRFLREAGALARCQHRHIVRFREPFIEQGVTCLVMDYVAGVDLASLPERRLSEAEALHYIGKSARLWKQFTRRDWCIGT